VPPHARLVVLVRDRVVDDVRGLAARRARPKPVDACASGFDAAAARGRVRRPGGPAAAAAPPRRAAGPRARGPPAPAAARRAEPEAAAGAGRRALRRSRARGLGDGVRAERVSGHM
jgi:hypothetical protein